MSQFITFNEETKVFTMSNPSNGPIMASLVAGGLRSNDNKHVISTFNGVDPALWADHKFNLATNAKFNFSYEDRSEDDAFIMIARVEHFIVANIINENASFIARILPDNSFEVLTAEANPNLYKSLVQHALDTEAPLWQNIQNLLSLRVSKLPISALIPN